MLEIQRLATSIISISGAETTVIVITSSNFLFNSAYVSSSFIEQCEQQDYSCTLVRLQLSNKNKGSILNQSNRMKIFSISDSVVTRAIINDLINQCTTDCIIFEIDSLNHSALAIMVCQLADRILLAEVQNKSTTDTIDNAISALNGISKKADAIILIKE